MAHRGMKKFREVEKIGLVALCVLMLGTLGIGMGPALRGCGETNTQGTFHIAGETVQVGPADWQEYRWFLLFQNRVMSYYGLTEPPPWKFSNYTDPEFRQWQAGDKDLWTFIILDKVAERAGIESSPDFVKDFIEQHFLFQTKNGFSRERYEQFLGQTGLTAAQFEKLVGRYLRVKYLMTDYQALAEPTHEQIYNTWRQQNQRHDIDYFVQPVAPIRKTIDPTSFSEADLKDYYAKDRVKSSFRIPTKWAYDAVYLVPADLTDAEFAALKEKAKALPDFTPMTEEEAKNYYYANQKTLYPIEPLRDRLKKEWEEAHPPAKEGENGTKEAPGAKDATPPKKEDAGGVTAPPKKEDAGGETPAKDPDADKDGPGTEAPKPDAPKADAPKADAPKADAPKADAPKADAPKPDAPKPDAPKPDAPKEGEQSAPAAPGAKTEEEAGKYKDPLADMDAPAIYAKYFKARVERELFVERLLRRLLKDERIDRKGLHAIAEKWGLEFYETPEPLDRPAILRAEPFGGQDLAQTLQKLDKKIDKPEYAQEITRFGEGAKRGWGFFLVTAVEPEHFPELDQVLDPEILRLAVWNAAPSLSWSDVDGAKPYEVLSRAFPDADVPKKDGYTVEYLLRLFLRQAKAEDQALEKLTQLKEAVVAGNQSLEAAAREKGYSARTLDRITEQTQIPALAKPAEGKSLTPEQEAENRRIRQERFIVKGGMPGAVSNLKLIAAAPAQSFLPRVLTDRATDAAYLVYVRSHRIPGPQEMPETEATKIGDSLRRSTMLPTLRSFFKFPAMVERYQLVVPGLTDEKKAGE